MSEPEQVYLRVPVGTDGEPSLMLSLECLLNHYDYDMNPGGGYLSADGIARAVNWLNAKYGAGHER